MSSATSTPPTTATTTTTASSGMATATTTVATTVATNTSTATTTAPSASAATVTPDQLTLSTLELQLLSEIDSRQFGFLKLSDDSNIRKKTIITKAVKYLERFIVRARERQRRAQVIFYY